jgi:hypothetical protein
VSGTTKRHAVADAAGLAFVLLALLQLVPPSLLLLPTITAGGDTPSHYPTAAWFHEHLLPQLRLHGWYPGASLGHPLLLYYFPLPFLLMSGLVPLTGLPVAFKLGTALGVFLLPLLAYVALRLMRLAFPAPLLGAAAAFVFLCLEDNPIWGGTIASTLAGEFSYTYGAGLALLFLGVLHRSRADGRSPWLPGAALALTCSAHGYAVLWAGLSASALLLRDPARPGGAGDRRTLAWLLAVAAVAFALCGPFLVPLLAGWGFTTAYDDPWIDVTTRGLLPPLLWPLFAAAGLGLGATLLARARADSRLVLLGFAAAAAAALAAAGPRFGVVDVRFVPFAQLALALAGAASVGVVLSRLALADAAALGLVLLGVAGADGRTRVVRAWADWNYSGLEAKELWPAWRALNERLRGTAGDHRVAFEYSPVHERAGSLRVHETVPFFSGRSGIEGVYNQSSVTTHPVYYLISELFPTAPNPFRNRSFSRFDLDSALSRLRLIDVGKVVAVSPQLVAALDARPEVVREASVPPYTVYRLADPGPGLVEPLALAPVRAPREGWRDAAYFWFSRKPANRALLVFTDDERFPVVARGPWAALPEVELPPPPAVRADVQAESIRIETARPGHPLLVKVSYHPRWRAEGAYGPYLAAPGFLLVVPEERVVTLRYDARAWPDHLGLLLLAVGLASAVPLARRRSPSPEPASPPPGGLSRLVPALPVVLLAGLAGLRLLPAPGPGDPGPAHEDASRAYAAERWADAAEAARHALVRLDGEDPRREELLCLRGEALLRWGHPREAALAFGEVVDAGAGPYAAQALSSGALAREGAGDAAGAAEWRRRLLAEHPGTPWADRLVAPPAPR